MTSTSVRPADIARPPVWECGVAALILVVVTVVYLAAHLPGKPSTVPAYVLLGVASALVVTQLALIGGLERFSRRSFHQVGGWSLAAYAVIGGMIEYVFLRDQTRGEELALLTWGLALFVVQVPLILGFTVARYQQPD
ncbi:MAG TPA: hypothetical protein VF186_03560 [Gaiellaceae bacterium]